jgi:enhancer of polycomb-like protein
MEEEDAVAFKILNQKRNAATQCSEDFFEEVMTFFEDIANAKHKYAFVDGTPILSFDEFRKEETFKEAISETARIFAEDIYEHWSARRTKSGNQNIQPALKVRHSITKARGRNMTLTDTVRDRPRE